ncbi:protoporphyrinogen oxidase [bacterium]|nr:protoporphyrinogen oxidase [bacterium]MBU1918679.1 protoporphyrinogen oxidase [bacterium]
MSEYDVIIIGAGISGLTTAYLLHKKGYNILVLEKNDSVGGHIKTTHHEGFQLEAGPHSFLGSSEYIWKLIEKLDFESQAIAASSEAKNRYIYRNKKLHPLPLSPFSFLKTPLLSLKAKGRLMIEPFIPNGAKEEETAWDFFQRRFGKEAATYIMSPFVSGVYAGNVEKLGAKAAFPKFWQFENDSGSMIWGAFKYMRAKKKRFNKEGLSSRKGLYSFKQGLGQITKLLGEKLKNNIRKEIDVLHIKKESETYHLHFGDHTIKTKTLVIATPPKEATKLLSSVMADSVKLLNEIPMAPVTLIHWTVPKNIPIPPGFGFLMPKINNKRVLGTLFPSYLFPNRAPDGHILLASFYGGMLDPIACGLSASLLTNLLLQEHKEIFNTDLAQAKILKITRYEQAIPQLLPTHLNIINAIEKELKTCPGIFLAGNYITGVGMEQAVASGFQAAEKTEYYLKKRKP